MQPLWRTATPTLPPRETPWTSRTLTVIATDASKRLRFENLVAATGASKRSESTTVEDPGLPQGLIDSIVVSVLSSINPSQQLAAQPPVRNAVLETSPFRNLVSSVRTRTG